MVYSKKSYCFNIGNIKNILYFLYIVLIALLVITVSDLQPAIGTEPTKDIQILEKNEQIHITSDLLTTHNEEGLAEFSGNVRVVQGDTVITSDRFKIFYQDTADESERLSAGFGAVEKIIASGQVHIKFEGKEAFSDEAVYFTESQTLTLSGSNSTVISGNESISGAKITLYQSDGRIKVESNEKKRVEAIFYNTKGN
jgi:lipopolysaccharide export system protein LptA